MQVRQLQPGDEFTVDLGPHGKLEYRLIYHNDSRAYVEPLRKTKRTMDLLDDESGGGRVNIAPTTECVVIDADLEDFMGTVTKTATTTTKSRKEETKKDPYKQERPVKEGTIRAKLLAAIHAGRNNLDKLAKEFDTPRTNICSHIRDMWRFHGYGFTITGDTVKIVPPVGGALKAKAAGAARPSGKKAASRKKKEVEKDLFDEEDDFLS